MKLSYDNKSFIINGKRILLTGGEFHYFRVPNELWEDRLLKMKKAGANFVSTYIPWNWHQPEENNFKWDGDRDLVKFLELCKKYGFYVALKPGPYICAEWDNGGFPDWLLSKKIIFRIPSKKYIDYTKKWFEEVAKVIKPYLFTNGGNVILFQIENEYDHLIEQQKDIIIHPKQAKNYLLKLLQIAREYGIDVIPFTNEALFIHGTEIIETRTYYPNIPWLWMWEFEDFDRKIELSKITQKDKPICIFELQAGWFGQFGKPLFTTPPELTDAIMKHVLIKYGAALLNVYMFVGGTTFPYWGCRGDARGKDITIAIGSITSYDFGGAPIREWGSLNEKFYNIKLLNTFINNFSDEIINSTPLENETEILEINNAPFIVRKQENTSLNNLLERNYLKLTIIQRNSKKAGFLLVRNTENIDLNLKLKYLSPKSKQKRILPINGNLLIPQYKSYILPIDIDIPETNYTIEHSTSQLLLIKKINDQVITVLYGINGTIGETIISGVKTKQIDIQGDLKYEYNDDKLILSYIHNGINFVKIDNAIFIITEMEKAYKIWEEKNFLILSDFNLISLKNENSKKLLLESYISSNLNETSNILFIDKTLNKIEVDGKDASFTIDKKFNFVFFKFNIQHQEPVKLEWSGNWYAMPDSDEKSIDYNDRDWKIIEAPISLEEAGFIKHGYYWFRTEFNLSNNIKNLQIHLNTGGIDRAYFYLNGEFIWKGIGENTIDITKIAKSGKNILAIRYENAFHTKGHPAEGPIQKYSGITKPIFITGKQKNKNIKINLKKFKVRYGLKGNLNGYEKIECNTTNWIKLPNSNKYLFHKELGDILWLRRTFKYYPNNSYYAPIGLKIKEASERIIIYLNGYLIGKYEEIGPQNIFYLPENMLKEDNLLALIIEGPAFEQFKPQTFKPAFITEPEFVIYDSWKKVNIEFK